jgi:hypothetical protein
MGKNAVVSKEKRSKELQYSANLTGEPFLLKEIKVVTNLILLGFSPAEIKEKVIAENLFLYSTPKSTPKILACVMKRCQILSKEYQSLLVGTDDDTSRLINLYAIVKLNLLFHAFLHEVVQDKRIIGEPNLTPSDFITFFRHKSEQSDVVASWKEYTLKKLSSVYKRILFEVKVINNTTECKLQGVVIPGQLKLLMNQNDTNWTAILGKY